MSAGRTGWQPMFRPNYQALRSPRRAPPQQRPYKSLGRAGAAKPFD